MTASDEPASPTPAPAPPPEPVWTVVANMTRAERGGTDPDRRYFGTRLFSAGAKLYFGELYAGNLSGTRVIGLARDTKKLVNCAVDLELLENVRPAPVYAPTRIYLLKKLEAQIFASKVEAERRAETLRGTIAFLKAEHAQEPPE